MGPIDTKTANQLATGSPGSIQIGEQTYLLSQPLKGDFVTWRKHVTALWKKRNAKPITAVADQLKDLPPELQQMAVAEAVKLGAGNLEPDTQALLGMLTDPDAVAFFAWLLIRKNHPDVTLDALKELIGKHPEAIDTITADVLTAASLKAADPNSVGRTGSSS